MRSSGGDAAIPNGCGCSSGVEHDLAKVGVEGSNPFARSSFSSKINGCVRSASLFQSCPTDTRHDSDLDVEQKIVLCKLVRAYADQRDTVIADRHHRVAVIGADIDIAPVQTAGILEHKLVGSGLEVGDLGLRGALVENKLIGAIQSGQRLLARARTGWRR